jgi:MFS family permease
MRWNPWRGLGRLPRAMWLVSAVTLIHRAGTMIMPFLVLYLTEERGVPAARAGAVLAVYGAGSLISGPLGGWLTDRLGANRVMEFSLVAGGALAIALAYVPGFWPFLAAVFLWAMVAESFRAANLAAVSGGVPAADRRASFALLRLAVNLGMGIGPAVAGFLVRVSFPLLFWIDGATSIVAGAVLAVTARHRATRAAQAAPPPTAADRAAVARPYRDRRFVLFLVASLPVIAAFFQLMGAMALHLVHNLRFAESTYGLLITLNTAIIVLLEVPLNLRTAHWSHRRGLILGSLLVGIGFGALAVAESLAAVTLTVIVWTFGEMVLLPGLSACAADFALPARQGEYMGLYQLTFSIAFALGPWAGAAALGAFGPAVMWAGVLVASALSALAYARLRLPAAAHGEPAAVPA